MNMLRNIKFRLSALAVLLLATSCLDKYPESAIPEKDAMKTFADAEQTLTGIYATFKSSSLFSGRLTLLPDIQADLVYAVEGNSNQFGNFWRWDVRPTDLDLEGVYADLYTVISRCNFFLERIDEVMRNEISDDNLEDLEEYTGEVYAIRALCYSELLKNYCKAYDPATAQSELGVVIRTKYSTPEPIRRASLYDSYKFVLDDLAEAEKRLDKEEDAYSNEYITSAAAQALHARVALYMQDWDTAIEYASILIDDKKNTFKLADAKTKYNADYTFFDYMWAYDLSYEIIWRIGFTETSYGSPLGTVFLNFTKDLTYYYPDYVPATAALNLYDAADLRYSGYFAGKEQGLTIGYTNGLDWPMQPQLHQQADLPRFDAQAVPAGRAVPDPRRSLLPQERLHEGRQRPHGAAQDALRFGRHAERLEKQLAADHLRRARARTLHGGFPPARPQALGQGVRRPERRLQHPPHAAVVLAARRPRAQENTRQTPHSMAHYPAPAGVSRLGDSAQRKQPIATTNRP